MFFTTTFAYPLSKSYMKGRNALLNMVIVTMLFSGGMIPSFLWIQSLGLSPFCAAKLGTFFGLCKFFSYFF